jgi:hypothetical protein
LDFKFTVTHNQIHFSMLVSSLFCASVAIVAPTAGSSGNPEGGSSGQCPNAGISAAYKQKAINQLATDQIVPDLIERINPTLEVSVTYDTPTVGVRI